LKEATMELIRVQFKVNGDQVDLSVKPYETLLETLRNRLELTGTKEGCGLGSCGACTVLLDGMPVRSCLVLTAEVNGREITTIEGLKQGDKLHPLQEAFVNHGAVQCGFCTPGMILTAKALLDRNPKPTRSDIIRAISSNICRCTGYKKIIEAIEAVAQREER